MHHCMAQHTLLKHWVIQNDKCTAILDNFNSAMQMADKAIVFKQHTEAGWPKSLETIVAPFQEEGQRMCSQVLKSISSDVVYQIVLMSSTAGDSPKVNDFLEQQDTLTEATQKEAWTMTKGGPAKTLWRHWNQFSKLEPKWKEFLGLFDEKRGLI